MKRTIKIFAFVSVMIFVLLAGFFFISPIINNRVLSNFANQLNEIKLPPKTRVIKVQSICGKLTGNGNGMDFLGCALIKSEISLLELEQFVNKIKYKPAKSSSEYSVLYEIKPVTSYKLNSIYLEHGNLYFETIKNKTEFNNLYYLIIYDGGYDSGFDLRGH